MKSILTRCGYRCDLCLAYKSNVAENPSNPQKLCDGWHKYLAFGCRRQRFAVMGA
jgi:hypothetical protein